MTEQVTPKKNYTAANDARRTAAAAENVETIRQARDDGSFWTLNELLQEALTLRVQWPSASYASLGKKLGISKDAYAARLARGIERLDNGTTGERAIALFQAATGLTLDAWQKAAIIAVLDQETT